MERLRENVKVSAEMGALLVVGEASRGKHIVVFRESDCFSMMVAVGF